MDTKGRRAGEAEEGEVDLRKAAYILTVDKVAKAMINW